MSEPKNGFRSIILPAPEVERLVDPFREAHDWWHRLGVPAHLTLAGPWPLETELPLGALAELARQLRGLRFDLGSAGRLGSALCLFPIDDRALTASRERIIRAVGVPDLVDEEWRLHLTVGRLGKDPMEADEVLSTLERGLPIACGVAAVLIAEMEGGQSVRLHPL
jgi:hypothetical protein